MPKPGVRFAQDATEHEIDLNAEHAGVLPGELARYMGAAVRAGPSRRIAEVVDAFAGFDVVEELLVTHGVREVRQRFGDLQRLGGT